jgi:hypothetical protein
MINMPVMHRKAQGDIISAVILVVIALGLVGTVYTWGMPLIEKQQGKAVVERLYSYFDKGNANSLPRIIEDVANNGGEKTFYSTIEGLWALNEYSALGYSNNSLQFLMRSKISNIGTNIGWVSLSGDAACPPEIGILGTGKSTVVCARADSVENGYEIVYRLWLRELDEGGGNRGYKINLVRHESGPLASSGKSLRISRGNIQTVTQGSKTLIITEVKILLE